MSSNGQRRSDEQIRAEIEKIAALGLVLEIAEHVKTAKAMAISERLKKLIPGLSKKSKKPKAVPKATHDEAIAGLDTQIDALKGELGKSESLARGSLYAAAGGIPAAGLTGLVYGKSKGQEEGREQLIQELISG